MDEDLYLFEFIVGGTPLSLQAKGRDNLARWKETVHRAARDRRDDVNEGAWLDASPKAARILYFAAAPMDGDVDNIVKPILDAINGVAWVDDGEVERVSVQKLEPGMEYEIQVDTPTLAEAVDGPVPLVYVRVDGDLSWRTVA